MCNVIPEIMTSKHKSKWMHKTVDSNKGKGCQICSLKIDLQVVVMNDVKKISIGFSCVPPILKWNVVKVIFLPWLAPFKKKCLS